MQHSCVENRHALREYPALPGQEGYDNFVFVVVRYYTNAKSNKLESHYRILGRNIWTIVSEVMVRPNPLTPMTQSLPALSLLE